MADDPLFNFLQSVTEKIKVEKEHKALMEKIDDNTVVESKEDPLLSAINVLKQKIVEVKQPITSEVIADKAEDVEVTTETIPEAIEEDNFGDFLSKLKGIISGDKPENITPVTSTEATAPVVQEQENAEPKIEEKKPDVAVVRSDYVDVLDKLSNEVAVEKEPQKISEIKKLIEQYAEKYFKKAAVMSEYAGGGGTNAVQYAGGGVMNGNLSVNNLFPNNNTGEIGSPTNRWNKIYANQIDALSSNVVVELSGFFVDGDFTVNGVISATGGNSNQWNSNYTSFNSNSAKYDSNYTTFNANSGKYDSNYTSFNSNSAKYDSNYTTFNANSGKYDSNYTTTKTNSANWSSVYTTVNSNSANYILDGGNTRASDINIGTNDNYNLFLETNNLKNVVITRTGNVGIGTPVTTIAANQDLIGYNFFSLINSLASTASPGLAVGTIAAGLMTRAAGINGFASTAGWGSQGYSTGSVNIGSAIANTEYYTIPIYSTQNTTIVLSSLNTFSVDRSPSGPTNMGFLYGTSSNPSLASALAITSLPATPTNINTGINQALAATPITITPGTTGYMFLVPYGAAAGGGRLIFQSTYPAGSPNDLSFIGTITDEPYNKLTVAGTLSANTIDINMLKAQSTIPIAGTRTLTSLFLSIMVGTSSLYIPLYR